VEVSNKIISKETAAQHLGLTFKFNATDHVLRPEKCGYATVPMMIRPQVALPIRIC
jgi:hypothetical protein